MSLMFSETSQIYLMRISMYKEIKFVIGLQQNVQLQN